MNLLLKERVREAQVKSKDCIYLLSMAEERVNSQENLIKSLREINTTRRKEKEDKVILNKAKISTTQSSISDKEVELKEIESKISGTEDKASHLQELRQRGSDINSELKRVSKDMKFLKSHDDCPTCHQSIDKDFKETKISSLTESGVKLSKAYKKEQKAIEKVVSLIEQADALSMKAHELRSDISSFERDLVRLDSDNLQIEKELSELTSTPKIEKELKTLNVYTEELEQTKIDCGQVSKTIDEFTVVSSLLKDSGIKKQIIKKYVPVFNNLINKYLHSMDFFVNFTLDEEFNEVLKSRFRDEFSYSSFSEGEKQKIDLALLFTWREVARMKNSAATNLLILDEVFDSSLDADSTAALLAILGNLGKSTNIFVISHKGDILIEKFPKTLRFEKINDFSKLTEDA
tara:strand:+ start:3871 stop:5085 length:1215 start_codon:yes stop_codon:yes gene_type:complete